VIDLKCLVIGNFTVDDLNGYLNKGGSSYYSSWSLAQLGCNVHVLTSISEKYRELYRELYSVINIWEYSCPSNPVFVIKNDKAIALKERGCRISLNKVIEVYSIVKPDLLLFTPVFNEVEFNEDFLNRVLKDSIVTGLEIHGLTRDIVDSEIVNKWSDDLFNIFKYFKIVHGNIYEYCFSNNFIEIISVLRDYSTKHGTCFQISMDEAGLYLIDRGIVYYFKPANTHIVSKIGAGDVLLAVSSFYMSRRYNCLESTIRGFIASNYKMASRDSSWFNENCIEECVDKIEYTKLI